MTAQLRVLVLTSAASCMGFIPNAQSQTLSGKLLVDALRRGGYVIVMRHASSPRDTPDARTANADNVDRERQLDDAGRVSAAAFGRTLRVLKIPIAKVYTSPTYRARETVRLAGLPSPISVGELGDGGQSMQAVTDAQSVWLRKTVSEFPVAANTFVVTHLPNIANAFPQVSDVVDGEALVFGRDGQGDARIVARIRIDEWATLTQQLALILDQAR